MAKQRAEFAIREAPLASPFGRKMASRYFDPDTIAKLPRSKTGRIQAKVAWVKCERAGWVPKELLGRGYDEKREGKVLEVHLMTDPFREDGTIITSWRLP
jgi:hypothetical protein